MDGKLDGKCERSRFAGNRYLRRWRQSAPFGGIVAEREEGASRWGADRLADPVTGHGQSRGAGRFVKVRHGDIDERRVGAKGLVDIDLCTGEEVITVPDRVRERVSLTLEDQVVRLNMNPPVPVDPASVHSETDPVNFLLVDRLQWQRPLYLRIVTVLLVILISASAIFALGLRTLHELVLGIGGIILGIWGVRSVVVQTELPDVTLIDLILAFVMLVLLLALSIRAARYFYVQSRGQG